MEKFRNVFIGCVKFSAEMLIELIKLNYSPELVITKNKSNFNSDFYDLSSICEKHNIQYIYSNDINSKEIFEKIISVKPDVIFCFGWSTLIKRDILRIPKFGVVGYHPALLPANRGRHPIIWALVLGLNKTGSTFFIMDEGADTGDIVSQVEVDIDESDNALMLYNKMSMVAKVQLKSICEKIKNSSLVGVKQSNGNTNYWRKREPRDGEIDFRMSTKSILHLIRALSMPYPGAHFKYNNREIKVWEAIEGYDLENNIEPGKIIEVKNKHILVKTGDKSIWLINHELIEMPKTETYLL